MDQRACYRVGSHLALRHFELSVQEPGGPVRPAQMDEVSSLGLTARLSPRSGSGRLLHPGSSVHLKLACSARGVILRLTAIVRSAAAEPHEERYGLAFCDPQGLEQELPADLFSLFNRRRAPRRPGGTQGNRRMSLAGEDSRVTGTLADVSVSGLGVLVPGESRHQLRWGQRVRIAGRLAGSRLSVRGIVRRIEDTTQGRLYGIELLLDEESERDRRAIREFVARWEDAAQRFRRIAERRTAQRARPTVQAPVRVEILADGKPGTHATLRDLSITGAGVLVRAREDPELWDDEAAQLVLRLPIGEIALQARVRRGLLIDDRVCYGLEFDSTEAWLQSRELIQRFVETHLVGPEDAPVVSQH